MGTALLDERKVAPSFYEADETGWLEETARLISEGRIGELDLSHLQEYLTDMAKRDRRQVFSRLRILLAHWLKWEFQPDQRTKSWQLTILGQRAELDQLLDSGTLLNHARELLEDAYENAVNQAAVETGLPLCAFPETNPRTLEEWLALSFV